MYYNENQALKEKRDELLQTKRIPSTLNVNELYSDYVTDTELKFQISTLERAEDKTAEEIAEEKAEIQKHYELKRAASEEKAKFKKGATVEHKTLGIGKVTEIKKDKITVQFESKTSQFLIGFTNCLKIGG